MGEKKYRKIIQAEVFREGYLWNESDEMDLFLGNDGE